MAKFLGAKTVIGLLTVFTILNVCQSLKDELFSEQHLRERRSVSTEPTPTVPTATANLTNPISNATDNKTTDVKQEPPGGAAVDSGQAKPQQAAQPVTPTPQKTPDLDARNNFANATQAPPTNATATGGASTNQTATDIIIPGNMTASTTSASDIHKYEAGSTVKPPVVSEPISPSEAPKKALYPINDDDDLFPTIDVPLNDTEEELRNHNITEFKTDYHDYYTSKVTVDPVIASQYLATFQNITPNAILSESHRRAITIHLSFDFPFYGHPIRNITVATGGFIYTGEYIHSWLAATQYIAPLMANFDTSLSKNSFVKFQDNGTAFTVLWENVALQENKDVGRFTFSATLHNTGDIVFAYYSVPIHIQTIGMDKHPVKVGLSDAYVINKVIFFARRKTIYEYHRVNFEGNNIKNSTIIYLAAQPTCLGETDCKSCVQENPNFKCYWCPALNKCSTGTDRKRQDWLFKGCDKIQITEEAQCPAIGEKGNNAAQLPPHVAVTSESPNNNWSHVESSSEKLEREDDSVMGTYYKRKMHPPKEQQGSGVGLVLGLMLPICLIMSALAWILYAYRNPHTRSGQLLIQYRPTQWSWRRGEARYTAATIHM